MDLDRRRFVVAGGAALLAGCPGGENDDPTSTGGSTATEVTTTATSTPAPQGEMPGELVRVSEMGLEVAVDGVFARLGSGPDGIVAGGSLDGDAALVAFDADLAVAWARRYGALAAWQDRWVSPALAPSDGYTFSADQPDEDDVVALLKTDSRGRIEARRQIDVGSSASGSCCVELADGGYVAAWSERTSHDRATYVVGFDDLEGDPTWRREYAGEGSRFGLDHVIPMPDGGCLLSGTGLRTGRWMARLDADGSETWHYTADGHRPMQGARTQDGFVLGRATADRGTRTGFELRVVDPDGTERWHEEYDAPASRVHAVASGEDHYLVVSAADEGFRATTVDTDGAVSGRTRYRVAERGGVEPAAARWIDGRYVVTGWSREAASGSGGWIAVIEP